MKKHLPVIILILIFFVGISLMLYPAVSEFINSMYQSKVISDYNTTVAKLDSNTSAKVLTDAQKYNGQLLTNQSRFYPSDKEHKGYESLLNISGDGVIGYIEIPSIHTSLAIYHTVDPTILQVAAGHMEGTSLPVGGESTHCVISAHRGLPSAKLFSDLNKLAVGDAFKLHVLNQILTYQVDQILTVLPDQLDALAIEKGKDYCTLETCTPYGINTHRLLVRGHRVANSTLKTSIFVTADAIQIDAVFVAPIIATPIFLLLLVFLLVRHRKFK